MAETPPPVPPAEAQQQAVETRTAAEQAALLLFLAGVFEAQQPEPLTDGDLARIKRITEDLTIGIAKQVGLTIGIGALVDAVWKQNGTTLENLVQQLRQINDDAPPRDPGELSLQRQAARAFGNQAYTQVLASVAGTLVDKATFGTVVLKKMWVSVGDAKVRPLHRRLHGRIKRWDEDFFRWPGTGQTLSYPMDPHAPLDQIVNCRCICFLSWASESALKEAHKPLVEPIEELV